MMQVETSLFVSEPLKTEAIPTLAVMKQRISDFLAKKASDGSFRFEGGIHYKNVHIGFKLGLLPHSKRYTISFKPITTSNIPRDEAIRGSTETMNFAKNVLGDKFSFDGLVFEQRKLDNQVDISKWNIIVKGDQEKVYSLDAFFQSRRDILKDLFRCKSKCIDKKVIIIDPDNKITSLFSRIMPGKTSTLKRILQEFFNKEVELVNSLDTLKERIETSEDFRNECFYLFVGEEGTVKNQYDRFKIYLVPKKIPSQFLKSERLDSLHFYNNFKLEILKKCDVPTMSLEPLDDNVDGFICLSDIKTVANKLFGISILKKTPSSYSDDVEIFTDLDYETDRYDNFNIDNENVSKLSGKITALVDTASKTFDIYLTRNWKQDQINELVSRLNGNGVRVNKIFYISSMVSRFVTNFFDGDGTDGFLHPYTIIDGSLAFIQSNTKLLTYGTLFPLYIKLRYSDSADGITEQDIMKILWNVKKRVYRIDNFHALKMPEPVKLLTSTKMLFMGKIESALKIPLSLII